MNNDNINSPLNKDQNIISRTFNKISEFLSNSEITYWMSRIFIMAIIIGVIIYGVHYFVVKYDSFISGGTLNQLVSLDSQDLNLHGNDIRKYTNGQFDMPYGLPTKMYNINRGYLTDNNPENICGAYLGNEYIAPIPDIMKPL